MQNYIIDNRHINKDNKNIIDAYYINLKLPEKLYGKKIKLIEIKPLYENHSYKMCIVYEANNQDNKDDINDPVKLNDEPIKQDNDPEILKEGSINTIIDVNKNNVDDCVSIDLGMGNLMSIYDPIDKQYLIKGGYIIGLNNYYNYKIDTLKSESMKCNHLYTTKKIRDLLIERENKINHYFNKIVCWFVEKYHTKRLIVIGYNKKWKNKLNLGRLTNRKFYQIPFCRLLDKLKYKLSEINIKVVFNEESYTSKCDALNMEPIKKQNTYSGIRIKRGLFSSKINKLINADINGAINIMRKYFAKIGEDMSEIKGVSLYNPIAIKITLRSCTTSEKSGYSS
jgi:IS605 OrfB family transposase